MKAYFKIFILTFFLITSCTKSTSNKKKGKKNDLNITLTSTISTLDPAISYDGASSQIVYQTYETLYEYHYLKRPYTLKPLLAESMPIIEDGGKSYKIKIKKGILYHDSPSFKGKKRFLKAQDFIDGIKRIAYTPTMSTGWWLFKNKIIGIDKFRKDVGNDFTKLKKMNIPGLIALDDHTLVIKLKEPFPQLIYSLAMSFTSPIPMEAIEYYKNNLRENVIGTGPYQLTSWIPSSKIVLEKFKPYNHGSYPTEGDRYSFKKNLLKDSEKKIPFIDRLVFRIIKESQTRWLNFRAKKLDIFTLAPDNFDAAVDDKRNLKPELVKENIYLERSPTLTYWWLSFNMRDPILGKNLNLRKAIAHSMDVKNFIKIFTNNLAQKANSIFPPGIPGYNPSRSLSYSYNIELAKFYLKKAGYPNGKNLPELTFDVRNTTTKSRQMAEYVKKELEKIGIRVKVSTNTFPGFLRKAREGNLQFWLDGWAMDYPDPENSLQLLLKKNHPPGPNTTFFSNHKFEDTFEKYRLESNESNKISYLETMEKIVENELPWVMLYYDRRFILIRNKILNYRPSGLIANKYKYLRISNSPL